MSTNTTLKEVLDFSSASLFNFSSNSVIKPFRDAARELLGLTPAMISRKTIALLFLINYGL